MLTKNFTNISTLITRQIRNIQLKWNRNSSDLSDFEIQHSYPRMIKTPPSPMARYGGRNTVTLIPGCGIGSELTGYVQQVFKYAGAPVDFEVVNVDPNRTDNAELDYALMTIKRNGVGIKGMIETTSDDIEVRLGNVALRNDLDLYAYLLWCKTYPGVPSKYKDIDVIVVRENTEGEYSMLEHSLKNGVVQSLKIITRDVSTKLARFAFDFAAKNSRKKVTTVHKANIMKFSDGLFLEVCRQVSKEYPNIEHNDIIVDNCCMQLVASPYQFDVIVTPNLYGNIVSNVLCGLAGGPGLMSGRNYGDHYAVFEPGTRNRGVHVAGKNIANPVAMLNASVDMLYHLGHTTFAEKIEKAISKTLSIDKVHTPDLGGTATSEQVVESIINNVINKK